MTTKKAAELLGWSQMFVRHLCITGELGAAFQHRKNGRHTVVVYEDKVAERLGITVQELKEKLKGE